MEEGGIELLLLKYNGFSCLWAATMNGHVDVAKVRNLACTCIYASTYLLKGERFHHPNQFSSHFLRITNVMCYKWCACHVAYSGSLSTSTGSHVACAVGTGFLLLACPKRQSACPVCLGKERGERPSMPLSLMMPILRLSCCSWRPLLIRMHSHFLALLSCA